MKKHDETLKNWKTTEKVYIKSQIEPYSRKDLADEICNILNSYFSHPSHSVVKAYNAYTEEYIGYIIIDRTNTGHISIPSADIVRKAELKIYSRH